MVNQEYKVLDLSTTCLAIVHAGYAWNALPGSEARLALGTGRYGSYTEYRANVLKVFGSLDRLGVSETILIVGESYVGRKGYPPFNSENGETIGVTDPDRGILNLVIYEDQEMIRQGYYQLLRDMGIRTMLFIGEWSYFRRWLGCLGGAAKQFAAAGFEVATVEGCIFPTEKRETNTTLQKIYGNQVPLEELLKVA